MRKENEAFILENKNYLQMKEQLENYAKEQKKREIITVKNEVFEPQSLLATTAESFSLPSRKNRTVQSPIVDGKQKKTNKLMETLFTTVGWGAILAFLLQFPITICLWIFNLSSLKSVLFIKFNAQTVQTINQIFIAGYILVFIVGVWTIYNQNRYGKLNRRKFKPSVSDEEIKDYFQLDEETLNKMKSEKYIVLKDTIIYFSTKTQEEGGKLIKKNSNVRSDYRFFNWITIVGYKQSRKVFLEKQESNLEETTGCLVLNYHIVKERNFLEKTLNTTFSQKDQKEFTVSKQSFEQQIISLKQKGVYFATPEELYSYMTDKNLTIPDKCVLVTFDDADESVYTIAYPILERENIPSLIFIITNQVGNKNYNGLSLLDWKQIEKMKRSDLITFGTHTHDMHYQTRNGKAPFMNKKNIEDFKRDTLLSLQIFEDKFKEEPIYFAYPYGFGIPETDKVLKENKFEMIFSLREGLVQKGDSPFFVKRFLVASDNWWIVEEWLDKTNATN